MKMRKLVFLLGCLFSSLIFAQAGLNNPCPGGGVPSGGRCVSPAEAANSRVAGNVPVSREVWEDRFGAIAQNFESGAGRGSRRRKI